jgi:hypothetical protein
MDELFHLPLPSEAWQEYQALHVIIQGIQITGEEKDCWSYIWGKSEYSSSSSIIYSFQQLTTSKAIRLDMGFQVLK